MNANTIKDFLNMHGVPYAYKDNNGEVYEFCCYCYGGMSAGVHDTIRKTRETGEKWYIIDVAGNSTECTRDSLLHWLGYCRSVHGVRQIKQGSGSND